MAKKKTNIEGAEPKLCHSLLLNHYVLSLLGVQSFEELTTDRKAPSLEGWDEDNVSHFFYHLDNTLKMNIAISREQLRAYDGQIYRHTCTINRLRTDRVQWKYFQYLYLLFVEIYLDRYFSDRKQLLKEINAFREQAFLTDKQNYTDPFVTPITEEELGKLACWCATGAGKTLMMHVNILQVRHYAEKHGQRFANTLLVTPKEGLSRQHLTEMAQSDIAAYSFSKNSGAMMNDEYVQVIEITKLAEQSGDKTVAVDAFEQNNLVFVDEGHRGTSGETWKMLRDKLSAEGFCIEYSATFGQSIAAESKKNKKNELLREYGTATLFNYSYRFFYYDGYGKDFVTRNMNGTFTSSQEFMYLIGGLLGFYEQLRLHRDHNADLIPFMIEKPVAIFVGSTVSTAKANKEISDIVSMVKFFGQVISEPTTTISCVKALLEGTDGLLDNAGHSIYRQALGYLRKTGESAEVIYQDMIRTVFNQPTAGVKLHVDNLKGIDGEIGLRMGDADYFGVINVGNTKSVTDACEAFAPVGTRDFFQRSLFDTINQEQSSINILVGAKKFTEGWSSWRVATMCLLNVGSGDGSEIIQLFGRGVRLKGYQYSLKRSNRLESENRPDTLPEGITTLETLNIFGIKADYMDEFSKAIKEEGLPTDEEEKETLTLPLMPNIADLEKKRLKYLRLKKGKSFVRDVPALPLTIDEDIYSQPIVVDRYAHITTFKSDDINTAQLAANKNEAKICDDHRLNWIDWTTLYYDLLEYKREHGWYNLLIDEQTVKTLASDPLWYTLYIPEVDLLWGDFHDTTTRWQEIATTLLKGYIDKFYHRAKSAWVSHNLEVVSLSEDMAGINEATQLKIKKDLYEGLKDTLLKLKKQLEDKNFAETIRIDAGFEALYYARHLYSPLMYYNGSGMPDNESLIDISPVALNKSEHDFVLALMAFTKDNPKLLKGYEVYLLRNKSKTGIGFFADTGFYPDFILWIVKGWHQYVTFIDPHGLVHAKSFVDGKINLFKMLRNETEKELGDQHLSLNSFILSPTSFGKVQHWGKTVNKKATKEEIIQMFHEHHVFFMDEEKNSYVNDMIVEILK